MSDFISAFKLGVKAAKDLHRSELEIDEVFSELAQAMRNVTGGKFTIVRSTSTASAAAAAMESIIGTPPRARPRSDGGVYMRDVSDTKKRVRIANWVKQSKGFNFSLQFDSREIIARSQVELNNALSELLSSPVVGIAYLTLTNSSTGAASGNSQSGLLVAKAAARPAFKPAAAKAAAKSSAKRAPAKTAAKPAVKPAAAKTAAKPAVKPAAAKAAAKPAVKPAAAKTAAKPAVKPAAAKAAAKPVVKPAAAKTAAKPADKPAAAKAAAKPAVKPAAAKPAAKPAVPKAAVKPAAARPATPAPSAGMGAGGGLPLPAVNVPGEGDMAINSNN